MVAQLLETLLDDSELLWRLDEDDEIELLDLLDDEGAIDELPGEMLDELLETGLLLRELLDELMVPAESP